MRHLILPLLTVLSLPMLSQVSEAQHDGLTPGLLHVDGLGTLTITIQKGDDASNTTRGTSFCVYATHDGLFDISIDAPNLMIGGKDIPYDYRLSYIDANGGATLLDSGTVFDAPETIEVFDLQGSPGQGCFDHPDNMRFEVQLTQEAIDANVTGSGTAEISFTMTAQ